MPKIKLDPFEKDLVRMIKFNNPSYKFKFDDLQEWSSSKDEVLKNLREDEKIFEVSGFYVAMKIRENKKVEKEVELEVDYEYTSDGRRIEQSTYICPECTEVIAIIKGQNSHRPEDTHCKNCGVKFKK